MKDVIALPPYLPDQSANSGGLLVAENVYPRVDGYGPVNAFASQSDALANPFKGGASFIANDGTSSLLVGTSANLVHYAGGTWTAIDTVAVAGRWRFAQFGNYAVAVNGVETVVIDLATVTSGTLAGAPIGVCIAIVGDYVVIGQGSGDLLGIYTSAFNDHTGWTPGVNQSTIQPMLTGGEVMGLAGGEYGVILQRQRIVRMTRTGDSTAPFQYDEITPNVGCASKSSIIAVGRSVFFLSDRGFMALEDGQAVKPIGSEKVDRTFQSRVPRDDYERMFATVDPQNKLVIWCVPGTPGTLWIYNFELDRWSTAELVIDGIFSGFTSSLTLEEISAIYPNLDTMPYSMDDARFSGGNPRLYVVAGGVLGTLTGATLAATFEGSFRQYAPGHVARFNEVRPIGDSIAGDTFKLDVRARLGDPVDLRTAGTMRTSGSMPIRASGRYAKFEWTKSAGSLWSYAQGVELEFAKGGVR